MRRQNERGHNEVFFQGQHLRFHQLIDEIPQNEYLAAYRFVPNFPRPVKFCVSNLRHDTNLSSFQSILNDGGFKKAGDGVASARSLVWWSLAISEGDIANAEGRFLRSINVDEDDCKPFLHKFTSSPAFKKSSRLGNFRFTFSITELLASYSEQFCLDQEPQMRIYETVVYKQEVMHAIVVHGPNAKKEFKTYPLLQDSHNAACEFQNGKILWRPEGMSKTHAFRLAQNDIHCVRILKKRRICCAWDNVAVAFHVPQGSIFKFDQQSLLSHLSLCQGAKPKLNREEFIKCEFEHSPPQ